MQLKKTHKVSCWQINYCFSGGKKVEKEREREFERNPQAKTNVLVIIIVLIYYTLVVEEILLGM